MLVRWKSNARGQLRTLKLEKKLAMIGKVEVCHCAHFPTHIAFCVHNNTCAMNAQNNCERYVKQTEKDGLVDTMGREHLTHCSN